MEAIWLPFTEAFDAGLWLYWVTPTEIIAVGRPAIQFENDRLHCENGPAVEWPGGEKYFFWRGVQVPSEVIEKPESITVAKIDGERNAEVRRVMTERYGFGRYVTDSGAEVLHEDEDQFGRPRRLLRREVPGDEPIVLVEVTNSSPEPDGHHKKYHLRVHPQLRPFRSGKPFREPQKMTCHNAVASTFYKRGEEYAPVFES